MFLVATGSPMFRASMHDLLAWQLRSPSGPATKFFPANAAPGPTVDAGPEALQRLTEGRDVAGPIADTLGELKVAANGFALRAFTVGATDRLRIANPASLREPKEWNPETLPCVRRLSYTARTGTNQTGKGSNRMRRILVVVGLALLTTSSSWGQSAANCEQIRQAVAQYGYAAARAHAQRTYGPEAVRNGDKCLGRGGARGLRHVKHRRAKRHH